MLKEWEIKVLQHYIVDYKSWINHIKTVQKYKNGEAIGNLFDNPYLVISDTIKNNSVRMIKDYGLTDSRTIEEKILWITSQEDYKNRQEREEIKAPNLDKLKESKINELKIIRNEYKKDNGYYSENDHLIANICSDYLGDYTQEERQEARNFVNDLIRKYDYYDNLIKSCVSQENLDNIDIDFTKKYEELI